MEIIEKVKLINTEDGHSKQWAAELTEDSVIVHWGKIGGPQQIKVFEGEGEEFLEKKIKEKLKKNYKLVIE